MKLPFRKKQTSQTPQAAAMPPEVQEYYQAERRERTGIAWLLAVGTLIVTILLVLALFFGGRWIYQKLTRRDNTNTTQTQSSDTSKTGDTTNQSSNGSSTAPSNKPSSGTSTQPSNSGTNSLPAVPPSSSSSTSKGVVPPSVARTNIPNTGPGDTVAIFFAVSLLGYLSHRFIIAKQD